AISLDGALGFTRRRAVRRCRRAPASTAPPAEFPGRGRAVFRGWRPAFGSGNAIAGDGWTGRDRSWPVSPAAPARSPPGGRSCAANPLPPAVAALAPTDCRVHGVKGADAGDPALALDVLEQWPVQVLSFATGHGLDIADHDQQLLGPRDRHVQPLGLLQETDAFRLIAAHQAEDDDVGLLTFERIHSVDREARQCHHAQFPPQLRDLVLVHGDDGDPQLLESKSLQVADHATDRLDLGAVGNTPRAALLFPAADRQPRKVAVEGPG